MSTADVSREQSSPAEENQVPAAAKRSSRPPPSPTRAAAWLLRATSLALVAAGAVGVVLAPGARGNASERVVDALEGTSSVLSLFVALLLASLILWAMVELVRSPKAALPVRAGLVGAGASVTMLVCFATLMRDHASQPWVGVLLAATTSIAAIAGAWEAARRPHTRALAGVLLALAFAAIARLGGWELASAAGERASIRLFGYSRGLATAGVLFEAAGQLVAVTWLGTRNKTATHARQGTLAGLGGQLGASLALALAFLVTYGVWLGVHSGASPWESVLHTALADAAGIPPPYGLDALATFLIPASLLLAFVAASQPGQPVAIAAAIALALVSRGAFDAPLRALCAVAAAQWAVVASVDERAMWCSLLLDPKGPATGSRTSEAP